MDPHDSGFTALSATFKIDLIDTDDEATESSSGGESADEQEKFAPTAASYAPIKERAKYRYLKKVCTMYVLVRSVIADLVMLSRGGFQELHTTISLIFFG